MVRRLSVVILLIGLWFVSGIVLESLPALAPLSVSRIEPSLLAATNQAVWIWKNSQLAAIDTTNGALIGQTQDVLGERVSTRDKRTQYLITTELRDSQRVLALTGIDLMTGEQLPPIQLDTVTKVSVEPYDDVPGAITVLSADEKTAYVILTERVGIAREVRLIRVDLVQHKADSPITLFHGVVSWTFAGSAALSQDGKRIFVTRTFEPAGSERDTFATRLIEVNLETRTVMPEVEFTKEVNANGVGAQVIPAPDGKSLYIMQSIWYDRAGTAFRFIEFSLENGQVKMALNKADESGCDTFFHRAPNHQDLWNWCYGFIRFLDPRSGQIVQSELRPPITGGASPSDYVLSADGKTLIAVFPAVREVVVFDLATRAVLRRSTMPTQAYFDFRRELARLLVQTASAKFFARPMLTLTHDEKWLAFVDVKDMEAGDGMWIVDTTSLKPIAHVFRQEKVWGVRTSWDGRALYALAGDPNKLYALDPSNGQVRTMLNVPFVESWGFVEDPRE